MANLIRKFMWMGVDADGLQSMGELKGVSLLEAIIAEWKDSGSVIFWDEGCCDDFENMTIENKAKHVLWSVEQSFVDGTSGQQIIVVDITDHDNPIIVFPIDQRPPNFESDILGIKYTIQAWIPADPDDPETYDSMESAESDLNQLQMMQPENRYEIHEVLRSDSK